MSRTRRQIFKAFQANKQIWTSILLLLITSWVAHFYFFQNFGLYEDDYYYVGLPLQWDFKELWHHVQTVLTTWPQGRPVGLAFPQLLAFLGFQLAGISGVYLIGFAIVTLNIIGFYVIARTFLTSETAFLAALIFCLFPADTTQTLLTHSLQLQSSLLFAIAASYCLLHQKKKSAYFLGTLSLLTYETPFLILFWIPLLNPRPERPLMRRMILHFMILCVIVLVIFSVRKWIGEERAMHVDLDIFQKILTSLILGPWTVITVFLSTPSIVLSRLDQESGILIFFFFSVFLWKLTSYQTETPRLDRKEFKLLLLSGFLMMTAYLWSFSHFPPSAVVGRLTSVHLAAVFGSSLMFAVLASIASHFLYLKQIRTVLLYGIALYLGLLMGYRWMIQKDFEKSWQNQQAFWTEMHYNLGDLSDDTLVLVDQVRLPQTRFIATHSWADFMILKQLYSFPENWKSPPRLFLAKIRQNSAYSWQVLHNSEWSEEILKWSHRYSKVILLVKDVKQGLFFRPGGEIQIGQKTFELSPPARFDNSLIRAPLFNELIRNTNIGEKNLDTFLNKERIDQSVQRKEIRKLQQWLSHVDSGKFPGLSAYLQTSIQKIYTEMRY
ncbi:MAG: hypothetical protein HQM13_09845 [SAR324 cluster bacterium]|nr:hypothetical protein [SAR324 cluster bacterium]